MLLPFIFPSLIVISSLEEIRRISVSNGNRNLSFCLLYPTLSICSQARMAEIDRSKVEQGFIRRINTPIHFFFNFILYFIILADTINYPPTITKSDICIVRIKFVLRSPENLASAWELEGYIDAFWAGSPSDRQAISTRDIVFFCGRKSYNMEKQEEEEEEEENTKCSCSSELTWLQHFLQELGFSGSTPIPLLCDNQVAILILYT